MLLDHYSVETLQQSDSFSDIKEDQEFGIVSLFSGCGGMDLGFIGDFESLGKYYSKHPFRIEWANEINDAACKTYRKNIGHDINSGDIWEKMDSLPEYSDLVIGGFPCQDISVNGKGAGISGKRSGLYKAMVEVIDRVKPKMFVAENVKGLLMKKHERDLQIVLSDFRCLGYDVTYQLYNAADFGVPQTRDRVIIVGTRKEVPQFIHPNPVYQSHDYITAEMALYDLVELDEDHRISHIWSKANKSPDQGSRRLKANRPGYTIRAECHGNIQWHYELPRRISMREAARIQSFPDNFMFESKLRETERQIGNAVPPILAWYIAQSAAKCLISKQ